MKGVIYSAKETGRTIIHRVSEHWGVLGSPVFVKVNKDISIIHYPNQSVDSIFIIDRKDNITEVCKADIPSFVNAIKPLC